LRRLSPTASVSKAYQKVFALEARIDTEEIYRLALSSRAAEMALGVFQISLKRAIACKSADLLVPDALGMEDVGTTNEGALSVVSARSCDIFTASSSSLVTILNPTIRPGEAASSIQTKFLVVSSASLLRISFSHDAAQSSGNSWRWGA
jgi:hypothetical protein